MIGELGSFVLVLASFCAVISFIPIAVGAGKQDQFWTGFWKPTMLVTFLGFAAALLLLGYAFLTNDFSIAYVANHSNRSLPDFYKVSAIWGSHEGSMLLWIWTICAWSLCYGIFSKDDANFKSKVFAAMLGIIGLLGLFLIFTSNPFARNLPFYPLDGKDLNPILQDVGMIFHPPLLFLGYAGLALVFCLGIAGLVKGKLSSQEVSSLTTVSVITWLFLTAGNMLGSWWAYNELGWGGWWFWDPVENSSFIPWLLMTGQLHALLLLRYNQKLLRTVIACSIFGFAFCLIGTFIVRSGVIQSVHAFASDPNRGNFLLCILALIVLPAIFYFAAKFNKVSEPKDSSFTIAEISVIFGVLLLVFSSLCILFGTLYPLIYQAIWNGSLSIGAPYFNSIFVPMVVLAAILISAAQLRYSRWPIWTGVVCWSIAIACYCGFMTANNSPVYTALGVFSASAIVLSGICRIIQHKNKINWFALVAHFGIAVSILGVVGDTQYQQEAVVRMGPGYGRPLGDLIFVYDRTAKVDYPSFYADEGHVMVLNDKEEVLTELYPQRQTFKSNGMQMTAAGISHGFFRDLYVSMGNKLSSTDYLVRISIKPLVSWIWLGGCIMLLSSIFFFVRRRKNV